MATILMLHPALLFYKMPLYGLFADALRAEGHEFEVWATSIQDAAPRDPRLRTRVGGLTKESLRERLGRGDVLALVNILFRREPSLAFYCQVPGLARQYGAVPIYYGHGLNLERMPSILEKWLSNLLLLQYRSLILYTNDQVQHLWRVNRRKVSVAWNTLFLDRRWERYACRRQAVRAARGWEGRRVILFSARLRPQKRVDILLEYARVMPEPGWVVVVGPGGEGWVQERLGNRGEYLGAIYDEEAISEIFAGADLACIPGNIGLSLVECLYWGLPMFTLDGRHGPEIAYLENGVNGVMATTKAELFAAMSRAIERPGWLAEMQKRARLCYRTKCAPSRMVAGFVEGVRKGLEGRKRVPGWGRGG